MNLNDPKVSRYALVREMLEAPAVAARIDWKAAARLGSIAREWPSTLLTGEGSSRIFPAHNAISLAWERGGGARFFTEGSRHAAGFRLARSLVLGISNSGRTREVVELMRALRAEAHEGLYAVTSTPGGALEELARETFVLRCGKEEAIAATKSVIEQALFCQIMALETIEPRDWGAPLQELAKKLGEVLLAPVEGGMAPRMGAARTLHVAGRNDGVAEELALKCCEIARKKSVYCEGTRIVHGLEEVMSPRDAVLLVDPFETEWEKYETTLAKGVGLYIVAISSKATPFPTLRVPSMPGFDGYLQLAAGWRLLTAMGLIEGIDLDRTARARKIGNEVEG